MIQSVFCLGGIKNEVRLSLIYALLRALEEVTKCRKIIAI